jgi:molybdopterin-binding protein
MKLSARNQLKGRIIGVQKGATTAHVRIDLGHGLIVVSSITNEAVDDLQLAVGDTAWAVIKASDVMVAKE